MSSLLKNLAIRSGILGGMSRLRPTGIAILMYHSVLDRPESEANTLGGIMHSSEVFRGQMEIIARHFSPVSLDDALQFLRQRLRVFTAIADDQGTFSVPVGRL